MFRFGYRPSYYFKHPIETLRSCYWDIYTGIGNLIRWLPIIWFDADFDHAYLLTILEFKLAAMATHFRSEDCPIKDAPLCAHQTAIASELCRRINNGHYYWHWQRRPDDWCPPIGPWLHRGSAEGPFNETNLKCYDDYMKKQDLALLASLIEKHLTRWWS